MISVKVYGGATIKDGVITFAQDPIIVEVDNNRKEDSFWADKKATLDYLETDNRKKRLTNGQRTQCST